MCDDYFSDAFNTLDKALHEAAKDDEPGETEVVLAGGGFRNSSIREEVKERIKDQGFVLYNSTPSGFDNTESKTVALGAAEALVQAITTDEFMETACFAVRDAQDTESPHSVIWSNGSSRTSQVTASGPGGDEKLIIVCHPALTATDMASIDETPSYEFSKLPVLPWGDYTVRMDYEASPSSDDGVIVVHIHAEGAGAEVHAVRYPIYYDCASRLCFRDIGQGHDDLGTEHQFHVGFEEPDSLRLQTREKLKAEILDRTKYRPSKRKTFLSALDAIAPGSNRIHKI